MKIGGAYYLFIFFYISFAFYKFPSKVYLQVLLIAPAASASERGDILTLPHVKYFCSSSYFFQSRKRETSVLFHFKVMLVLFEKKQVSYFILKLCMGLYFP